jgi:TRAP-type C4-dicarboxylate transport system substrate-binding protein
MAVLAAVCGWTAGARAAEAPATLKVAIPWPEHTAWHKEMATAAERACALTKGRVKVELERGSLMTEVTELGVYGLPMTVRTSNEVERVHRVADPIVTAKLEAKGYLVLSIQGLGSGWLFTTKEMNTPDAFETAKVWIPESSVTNAARSYGLNHPVYVPPLDVRRALKDGEIDTIVTMPAAIVMARWHTALAYVLDTPFLYLATALAVKRTDFDALEVDDQAVVKATLTEAFEAATKTNRDKNDEAMALLRGTHTRLKFVKLDDAQMGAWREWSRKVAAKAVSAKLLPPDLVAEVEKSVREPEKPAP